MPSRTVHLLGVLAVALAMILLASSSQASPRIAVPGWGVDSALALDTGPWPSWSASDDEDDDHGDRHGDEDDDCEDDHDGDHDGDHDSDDDNDDGKGGSVAVERTSWSVLKGAY